MPKFEVLRKYYAEQQEKARLQSLGKNEASLPDGNPKSEEDPPKREDVKQEASDLSIASSNESTISSGYYSRSYSSSDSSISSEKEGSSPPSYKFEQPSTHKPNLNDAPEIKFESNDQPLELVVRGKGM